MGIMIPLFAIAIPLLVIGLSLSEVGPPMPGGLIEGNSILYAALKYAMFGRWLPGDGLDVQLHPMAFAGWVGLLITMINLLPIGQLDGGNAPDPAHGGHRACPHFTSAGTGGPKSPGNPELAQARWLIRPRNSRRTSASGSSTGLIMKAHA